MDGRDEMEGRVEVCFRGVWGTVCNDKWNNNSATVVCQQLGLGDIGGKARACVCVLIINQCLLVFDVDCVCSGDNCSCTVWRRRGSNFTG